MTNLIVFHNVLNPAGFWATSCRIANDVPKSHGKCFYHFGTAFIELINGGRSCWTCLPSTVMKIGRSICHFTIRHEITESTLG